jgi:hypothetical protein
VRFFLFARQAFRNYFAGVLILGAKALLEPTVGGALQ